MKKILFIITKSGNGGAQKWTKEQIDICFDIFECYLATDKDGWLCHNVTVNNTLLNSLIHKRFSIAYLSILIKFIKHHNIDLIVASSANAGIYARLAGMLSKNLKVIYVSHGWSSIYNSGRLVSIYTKIESLLAKITDSVLCISSKDYKDALGIIKIDSDKLKLIYNKILPLKKSIKPNNKRLKLLTVARLVPPKRVDLLIKSIKGLNIELHVVGDGEQKQSLMSMSCDNVFFHGEIDAFDEFYKYDIFVLISDSEGIPLSALEAMCTGMPLVLSDVGGCCELIKQNGSLVQNNMKSISNGIKSCIKNYDTFATNSKQLFDKRYNLLNFQDEYIEYYKSILKGK